MTFLEDGTPIRLTLLTGSQLTAPTRPHSKLLCSARHTSRRHPTCPINTRQTSPVNQNWSSLLQNNNPPEQTNLTESNYNANNPHLNRKMNTVRLPCTLIDLPSHHRPVSLTRIIQQVKSFWLADHRGRKH